MIIGNLTRDPEVKTTPQGTNVASFGVATNLVWVDQSGQKQEKAEFHNVVAWRKLADICGQYLKKGSKVYIEGRLQTRDWVGQDGVKRYRTEIVADNMIMLDSKPNYQSNQQNQVPAPKDNEVPVIQAEQPVSEENNTPKQADNDDSDEIKIENIPF